MEAHCETKGDAVTADSLLKHFDLIAEAPDAIPRLRRFILDLAVRGKLVEQDPNDEPAFELISRVRTKRKVSNRHIHEATNSAVKIQLFELPKNWEWIGAIELAEVLSDRGKKIQTKDVLAVGRYPVIDQGKIFIRGYCNDAEKVIKVDSPIIIFGDHTRETKLIDFDFIVGADGVKILKPIEVLPSYYFWSLQWLPINNRDYGRHFKLLRNSLLPLPPLAEQHRIVNKVNELMALCGELEAAQTKREKRRNRLVTATLHGINNGDAFPEPGPHSSFEESARFYFSHLPRLTTRPEHLQQLRKTILNLAVRGKLVSQNPTDSSVLNLLDCIAKEQLTIYGDRSFKIFNNRCNIEESNGLYSLPKEWIWVKLSQLIIFGPQNGVSPKPSENNKAPKSLTLTATTSGYLKPEYYKLIDINELDCEKYWLTPGDVLFQRGNTREYVGIAAIYDGPERTFVFPDLMIRVRFSELLLLDYIHTALISPPLRHFFSEKATGASSSMPKISQKVLMNTPIPLPPIDEQHRIMAKVHELLAIAKILEDTFTAEAETEKRILEATLRDALSS